MKHSWRVGMLVLAVVVAGCGELFGSPTHPRALTGRWVRLRADSTWGDTMTFLKDGSMRGSEGYPVPPVIRWRVAPDTAGGPFFCAKMDRMFGFCRPYQLRGDTLVLIGGPGGKTLFRRVRD